MNCLAFGDVLVWVCSAAGSWDVVLTQVASHHLLVEVIVRES